MNPETRSLHVAVKRGRLENIRQALRSSNVVVDAPDSHGFTPFALACRNNNIRAMRLLLEAGANPRQEFALNLYYTVQYSIAGPRRSKMTRTTAALVASALGNRELLELLIRFGVSANDVFEGHTLLVTAAHAMDDRAKDVVGLLLEHNADADVADEASGVTAMHLACYAVSRYRNQSLEVVRLLLRAGASVNLKDRQGATPLYIACGIKPFGPQLTELLLQHGAEVHVECEDNERVSRTPLMAVLDLHPGPREDKMVLVRLLVSHVRPEADFDFQRPLLRAARMGCAELTRMFLDRGASPNVAEGQSSPLHAACSPNSRPNVARMLLDAGAAVNAVDEEGQVPLHLACKNGLHRLAKLLLDAGADVNALDEEGRSALTRAARGHVSFEGDSLHTVDLLLSRGADVNLRDRQGRTPLHWALRSVAGVRRIVRLLLQNHADPNARDVDGRTPLDAMCRDIHLGHGFDDELSADLVYMLQQGGAEAEETTGEDGLTPFLGTVTSGRDLTLGELFYHHLDVLPDYD